MTTRVGAALAAAVILIPLLVIVGIQAAASSVFGASNPTPAALADIPADYLALYRLAASTCPSLDWSVLAAVGKVETDHGRSPLPGVTSGENPAGAAGPMQILATTWDTILARHTLPPGGAQPPSRYNPHDAIHAAAFFLCDHGAATGELRAAVYAYNHSYDYVDTVLNRAAAYRATAPDTGGTEATVTSWPAEQPSLPDPSGTGGQVTPRMHTLYQALHHTGALTGGATCWDPHPHNPGSDHPRGKACDVFFNPRNPNEVARGWQIAGWLTTQQPAYGFRYLIWQGHIWTADNPTWITYRSSVYGCPDPTNETGCHYDHIHISVY